TRRGPPRPRRTHSHRPPRPLKPDPLNGCRRHEFLLRIRAAQAPIDPTLVQRPVAVANARSRTAAACTVRSLSPAPEVLGEEPIDPVVAVASFSYIAYSWSIPRSFMAATICSDSARRMRDRSRLGATRTGILMSSTFDSGER